MKFLTRFIRHLFSTCRHEWQPKNEVTYIANFQNHELAGKSYSLSFECQKCGRIEK